MSKKTITITLPFTEGPALFSDGWCSVSALGVETVKGRTARLIAAADIGAAVRASWEEPASDYAKRLAEIEAWATRLGALEDEQIEDMGYEDLAAELGAAVGYVPWLLRQLRDASDALAAFGIPADGRPLAERMADLGKTLRGALHDAGLLRDMQGRKCHDDHAVAAARRDADILKRAARAAAIAGGEDVPEDAGPEAVAAALRRSTERAKVTAADLGDALREAQAELARRADPNGTWAKLEALAGKAAGIAAEVDSKG